MRAAHFYIRRTLSSSILLHDVHTELVYTMRGLKTALKKIILWFVFKYGPMWRKTEAESLEKLVAELIDMYFIS